MSKGRIVVVTPNEPYPFGQANGRWCHALLMGLERAKWDVQCLSVTSRPEWEAGARAAFAGTGVALRFYPLQHKHAGFSLRRKWNSLREPFSYPLSAELRRDVDAACGGCDVLHLEQLWSGYLADRAGRAVTSIHHLESLDLEGMWEPSLPFIRSKVTKNWAERKLIRRLTHVRATTDRLAGAIKDVNPRASIDVVPIALDPALFEFEAGDRTEQPTIGFIGSMAWSPSYLSAERLLTRIFPKVLARRPDAQLLLAGWDAGRLAPLVTTPNVEILPNAADAKECFFRLQAMVFPLPQGSGMMAKVLEAMAYGVPVVTTREGIEGFAADAGVHALIADDDDALVEHVLRVLRDTELRRNLRRNARALVEERYSPAATVAALERVYERL